MTCAPNEDSVWSESSLSAWRNFGSLATHWADGEDWSDWMDAQAEWTHRSFCWFVMRRVKSSFNTRTERQNIQEDKVRDEHGTQKCLLHLMLLLPVRYCLRQHWRRWTIWSDLNPSNYANTFFWLFHVPDFNVGIIAWKLYWSEL